MQTVKIDELKPDVKNANRGTERGTYMIERSLRDLGAGRSIVLDKNLRIIGGNKTHEAAVEAGIEDVVLVHSDGRKLIAVVRDDLDLEDDTGAARLLAYADNRTSQVSFELDVAQLEDDIANGLDLSAFWHEWEIEDIFDTPQDEVDPVDKKQKPERRALPIDVIFTFRLSGFEAQLAHNSGLLLGARSATQAGKTHDDFVHPEKWQHAFDLSFVDCLYEAYDHDVHRDVVARFKPKYATVRDIMTRSQCNEAGIAFFEFDQIIEWAEELREYAQNVILIPKYDCIDRIPDHFMLGYSVPSSHGSTPLPVEMFRGRRVHLLGGGWKTQLAYLAELGDDVVSLDNNYVNKLSRFGLFVNPDGEEQKVGSILPHVTNVRAVALSITFGNIASKIFELYGQDEQDP